MLHVGGSVTLDDVEVSAKTRAKVPGENLRVARAEFGAVWSLAERLGGQPGPDNDYLVGVLWTCRWLADHPVWSRMLNRTEIPRSPLTRRQHAAVPETNEAEYLAAVRPRGREPEFARGVAATLEWAWRGSGRPPLDIPHAAAG